MRHELHKAFKDTQKVWKRLLEETPRHFPKANLGWLSQGPNADLLPGRIEQKGPSYP
jgi:hypothetical protein